MSETNFSLNFLLGPGGFSPTKFAFEICDGFPSNSNSSPNSLSTLLLGDSGSLRKKKKFYFCKCSVGNLMV